MRSLILIACLAMLAVFVMAEPEPMPEGGDSYSEPESESESEPENGVSSVYAPLFSLIASSLLFAVYN